MSYKMRLCRWCKSRVTLNVYPDCAFYYCGACRKH